MGGAADTPQEAFARFVRRAIDDAREQRGWTVSDLAGHTGVGRSTVFRWLAGDWQDYPELAKVRGFCAALDVPVVAAFRALGLPGDSDRPEPAGWWNGPAARRGGGRTASPTAAAGERSGRDLAAAEADVRAIMSRLADPAVAGEEKRLLRDGLRRLAGRTSRRQAS